MNEHIFMQIAIKFELYSRINNLNSLINKLINRINSLFLHFKRQKVIFFEGSICNNYNCHL